MITQFPHKKNITTNEQAYKRNTTMTNNPSNKILNFAASSQARAEQQQYDQAKQAINLAASSLNW